MSDKLLSQMIWIHKRYSWQAETQYERPELYAVVHLGRTRVSLLKSINVNITEMGTWIHISVSNNVYSSSYITPSQSYQNFLFCIWFLPDVSIIIFTHRESIWNHCSFKKVFNRAKMWDIHHIWVWSCNSTFYPAVWAIYLAHYFTFIVTMLTTFLLIVVVKTPEDSEPLNSMKTCTD